jgi:hypothetical protein
MHDQRRDRDIELGGPVFWELTFEILDDNCGSRVSLVG